MDKNKERNDTGSQKPENMAFYAGFVSNSIFMRTKKLVLGGLLIAVNVLLPRVFLLIPNGGRLFLPMHIGVLIAGLMLGPSYGILIGAVAPLLGLLVNGMPQMPMAIFMMFELLHTEAFPVCS